MLHNPELTRDCSALSKMLRTSSLLISRASMEENTNLLFVEPQLTEVTPKSPITLCRDMRYEWKTRRPRH